MCWRHKTKDIAVRAAGCILLALRNGVSGEGSVHSSEKALFFCIYVLLCGCLWAPLPWLRGAFLK